MSLMSRRSLRLGKSESGPKSLPSQPFTCPFGNRNFRESQIVYRNRAERILAAILWNTPAAGDPPQKLIRGRAQSAPAYLSGIPVITSMKNEIISSTCMTLKRGRKRWTCSVSHSAGPVLSGPVFFPRHVSQYDLRHHRTVWVQKKMKTPTISRSMKIDVTYRAGCFLGFS
jgi:hypothetical protein